MKNDLRRMGIARKMAAHYPWQCRRPTSLRPETVGGNHMSVVIKTGVRVWGFPTKSELEKFVLDHPEP